jgi:hypothetical protein
MTHPEQREQRHQDDVQAGPPPGRGTAQVVGMSQAEPSQHNRRGGDCHETRPSHAGWRMRPTPSTECRSAVRMESVPGAGPAARHPFSLVSRTPCPRSGAEYGSLWWGSTAPLGFICTTARACGASAGPSLTLAGTCQARPQAQRLGRHGTAGKHRGPPTRHDRLSHPAGGSLKC